MMSHMFKVLLNEDGRALKEVQVEGTMRPALKGCSFVAFRGFKGPKTGGETSEPSQRRKG